MSKDKLTAKISFNPKKISKALLSVLNDRGRDILKKRYGLGTAPECMTLEAIGQEYHITRERVRQIENFSLGQIRKSKVFKEIGEVWNELRILVEKYGGVVHEREFFKSISSDKTSQNHIHFFLVLGDDFTKVKEDDDFHHTWVVDHEMNEAVRKALHAVHADLKDDDLVSEADMIVRFIAKIKEHKSDAAPDEHLARHWLTLSKKIGPNPLGEWGMSHSPNIKARGIRDYAYLILRKHGSPMHFREVAKEIAKTFGKSAHVATCHNELIKDSRFVLVGRGLYALTEWGYNKGTVKDIIHAILEKHGSLSRQDIIAKVLKERYVKENTIIVNLQNARLFKKEQDHKYAIA
ncbi:MAG: hypothetical protein A2542_02990 [Parcubacteria group bacterium RIFOXYD2_FULL_52_8]|nr:MAG: hypothetical protein A2542_02990 [Parcubacteria group bacterium RIFOXYD2_FULL_52_8]